MSNLSSRDSQARKRNLPSWMSDRPDAETTAAAVASSAASISDPNKQFSKLMKGVVFALSGFVNPERGTLRSQAIEMGAEYQPDWNSSCTLLVCAFSSTPKFRQVEADSGTIVSKQWISECYNQKKLVDIEPYLMNVGKPWRRQTGSSQANQAFVDSPSSSRKSHTQVDKTPDPKPSTPISKGVPENRSSGSLSPSKVKQWASDDFKRTITWLENQDEKPDESDMKKIAAEGIITCLQDTIDALKEGQNIKQITEEWGCIPRAVDELIKLKTDTRADGVSVFKQAKEFKRIYEMEYSKIDDEDDTENMKMEKTGKGKHHQHHHHRDEDKKTVAGDKTTTTTTAAAYDSDETIEMTEEEIDQAFNMVSSKLVDS